MSAFLQKMAWRRYGAKPILEVTLTKTDEAFSPFVDNCGSLYNNIKASEQALTDDNNSQVFSERSGTVLLPLNTRLCTYTHIKPFSHKKIKDLLLLNTHCIIYM